MTSGSAAGRSAASASPVQVSGFERHAGAVLGGFERLGGLLGVDQVPAFVLDVTAGTDSEVLRLVQRVTASGLPCTLVDEHVPPRPGTRPRPADPVAPLAPVEPVVMS